MHFTGTSRASRGFCLLLTAAHCTRCSIQATKFIPPLPRWQPAAGRSGTRLREKLKQYLSTSPRIPQSLLDASPGQPLKPRHATIPGRRQVLLRPRFLTPRSQRGSRGHQRTARCWAHLSRAHSSGCVTPADTAYVYSTELLTSLGHEQQRQGRLIDSLSLVPCPVCPLCLPQASPLAS